MAKLKYNQQLTALLVIDPYNDFISEGVVRQPGWPGCGGLGSVPHRHLLRDE
jgi:hypothetical protein